MRFCALIVVIFTVEPEGAICSAPSCAVTPSSVWVTTPHDVTFLSLPSLVGRKSQNLVDTSMSHCKLYTVASLGPLMMLGTLCPVASKLSYLQRSPGERLLVKSRTTSFVLDLLSQSF